MITEILASHPTIKDQIGNIWKGRKRGEPVISIENAVNLIIHHKNDWGRNATTLTAQLAKKKKLLLASAPVFEVVLNAKKMATRKVLLNIYR